MPLSLESNVLALAGPNLVDEVTRNELQVILLRPVQLWRCTWSDFKHYQARCYGYPFSRTKVLETKIFEKIQRETYQDKSVEKKTLRSLSDSLPNRIREIEIAGLVESIPHLISGSSSYAGGLEMLLPDNLPRDHFIPFGWIDDTMFCLLDDVTLIEVFTQFTEKLKFHCQLILADVETVELAYRRSFLRGQPRISCSNKEIVELLVDNDIIRPEQGGYVLEIERQMGDSSRDTLIKNHLITSDIWLKAYADLMNMTALFSEDIPDGFDHVLAKIKALIPGWVARKFQILPILEENGILVIGVSVMDYRLADLVIALTHLDVELRLMNPDMIDQWIEKIYPVDGQTEKYSPIHLETFLVEFGYLTSEQSQEVMRLSVVKNKPWFTIACKEGYLHEQNLVEALSFFTGCPSVSMDYFSIDEFLLHKFPQDLLNKFNMFPLFETEDNLWLAVADPLDTEGFEYFERQYGKTVCPVILSRSMIVQILYLYCQPYKTAALETQSVRLFRPTCSRRVNHSKPGYRGFERKKRKWCGSLSRLLSKMPGLILSGWHKHWRAC